MEELDNLLQVIANPAYFFDMETHRILAVNRGFADVMEYSQDELLEMTVADLRPKGDLAKLTKALAQSPPEGTVEWRYTTRTGKVLYMRLSYRNSLYIDKLHGRRHDVRLVVISSWDTQPLQSADDLFGDIAGGPLGDSGLGNDL
jgi:PAS domain S-box-containing protein